METFFATLFLHFFHSIGVFHKAFNNISKIHLHINWSRIIDYQTMFLSHGINKVGIPDLIIVATAIENDLVLFSFDKHFSLISEHIKLKLFQP